MRGDWSAARDPLAALQAGQADLYSDFVRSETATFLGFYRRLGATPEEAEDLTQDLFVRLYQHAPRYRQSERFAAFCFRIARNAWIDAERRRAVRPARAAGAGAAGGLEDGGHDATDARVALDGSRELDPLRSAATGESADRLATAVAALPEGQRLVFELGLVQELPYPDVASALGIPIGTVKSRMFHALRRLRDALGDVLDGEESAALAARGARQQP